MLPAAERRERRLAAGRDAEPLAVIVTRTGAAPLGVRLFAEAEARIVLFSAQPPSGESAAQISYEPLSPRDPRPLSAVLSTLRRRYGVRTLLCEGGPRLFDAMLREHLVDELFLTVAPTLAGGDGPAVASGPPPAQPLDLRLAALLRREGSVFLRYRVIN
jgi:5-amino-6-(5-phosphoribosylamino)uracil reductase